VQDLALKDTDGFKEMAEHWGRVLAVSHAQAGQQTESPDETSVRGHRCVRMLKQSAEVAREKRRGVPTSRTGD
jgi:hypothetical protein